MEHRLNRESIDLFEAHLLKEEKAEAAIRKYLRDIRSFFSFLDQREDRGDKDFISKETVIAYKEMLIKRFKPASVNSMLVALNCFLRFLGLGACVVRLLKIQRELFCPDERILSRREYMKLINAAKKSNKQRTMMIMETLGSTGMRVSELAFVTVDALKKGYITLRSKGKVRKILLPRKLCLKLKSYAASLGIRAGAVFITRTGKNMNRSNIWLDLKKLCRSAGVAKEKVFPHNFRHLFALTYYALEKDIAKLADVLGHSSVNTTRIYIIDTGAEHRRLLERLDMIPE